MTVVRPNLAYSIPEPPDGTRLVRVEHDGEQTVIWRNDNGPNRLDAHPDERWYEAGHSDPFEWLAVMKYAREVYPVASEPLTPEASTSTTTKENNGA